MAAGITLEFNSEEKRLSHSSLILSELDARMLRLSPTLWVRSSPHATHRHELAAIANCVTVLSMAYIMWRHVRALHSTGTTVWYCWRGDARPFHNNAKGRGCQTKIIRSPTCVASFNAHLSACFANWLNGRNDTHTHTRTTVCRGSAPRHNYLSVVQLIRQNGTMQLTALQYYIE